jgi:hypothetical protein
MTVALAADGENLLAMARKGFVNYSRECRHFSLPGAGGPAYDLPITRPGT